MKTAYVLMKLRKTVTIPHPTTGQLIDVKLNGMLGFYPIYATYEEAEAVDEDAEILEITLYDDV